MTLIISLSVLMCRKAVNQSIDKKCSARNYSLELNSQMMCFA